ncbi:hypothetical protein BH23BAC1_BH23BAC1_11600 [soil metagenome]
MLNEKGREDGFLKIRYDRFIKVNYIKGNVYDEKGKLVQKIKSSDIEDVSSISNISIFEDDRLKIFKSKIYYYPYTIEYEYEIITRGLLTYSPWYPIFSTETSLVKASFQVTTPKDFRIRYLERNDVAKPNISGDAQANNIYFWKVDNLAVIKLEEKGPDPFELLPQVMIGPYEFEMEGYKGNFSSWQSMGEWINQLNAGRDALSENTIKIVKDLVKDEPDELSKARKIYDHLQNNTRYVSIQLGIGGLQPFEASKVEKNGYGDCKALTNYTKSLLKVVGIESYYTLINAGPNASAVVTDFSSLQFNHAFLCLPLKQDTFWLECTDQQVPFGYLGYFTNDRHVLVVNEQGGKLVKTPAASPYHNLQSSKITVHLQSNGNASAEVLPNIPENSIIILLVSLERHQKSKKNGFIKD